MDRSDKKELDKIERVALNALADILDQEARRQALEGLREDAEQLDRARRKRATVEEILWKILGDGPRAQQAFDRINQRLRRQAKMDRWLRPWWRFWYGLRRFCRRVFGRRGEDG